MSTAPVRRARLRVPAEVALVAVTLAALVALHPLFVGWAYLPRLVLVALVAHGTLAGARAVGVRLLPAVPLALGVFALTTTWIFEASTSWYGLPTGDTWRAATTDLADGWTAFQEVVAPTPASTGFLLATTVAVWLAAFIADWAAFRLWAPFEAVVPTAGLVAFAAVLGAEDHPVTGAVVYLATALAFLLLHRAYRQETAVRWVATGTGRGVRALVAGGAALAAVALVAGVVVAPRLPGADEPGLIRLDGQGGGGSRVTLSPLVDIRSRLLDQRRVEVFTVRSAVPSYWRMTSLDRFDGDLWSSGGTFQAADGSLPNGLSPQRSTTQVAQEFHIEALEAIWLPAAYEPTSVDARGLDVRWEPASATLIVDRDRTTSDGTTYQVVSAVPRLDPAELRRVPTAPEDLIAHYTALPDGFSPRAVETAQRVTAGAATDYDRALALQDWFRDGFEYRTDVPAGHGESAIDAFLSRRAGFCEQFAGTYAAMARSLGIPARVAVGFTPGQRNAADLDEWIVRGENAHAWPEVYLSGFGWVAFEPTPGRGAPNAESYTGVRPDQATPSGDEITLQSSATPATTTPPATVERPRATVAPSAPAADARGGSGSPWPGRAAALAAVVLALAAAYLLVVAAALGAQRLRWRLRARHGPGERTRVAWLEANDAVAVTGLVPDPTETPLEFTARAGARLTEGRDAHRSLAMATTAADYADGGVSVEVAERAEADARVVVAGVRRGVHWRRRAARRLGLDRGRRRRRPR